MSHEYNQYIQLHDGTFWTLSYLPNQHRCGEFGLIRSRRVVNSMRAVSILITKLLIKTPWYTDQHSIPPSWQEPSSSSPFPWNGSFRFFWPIQENQVPNVNTIENTKVRDLFYYPNISNLFILKLWGFMDGFIQTGQGGFRPVSPWGLQPLSLRTTIAALCKSLSFSKSLFFSRTLWNREGYYKCCQRLRDRCQCRPPWQICHTLNAFSCPLIEQLSPLIEADCTNSITHHVLPLPSSVSPPFCLYHLIFLFLLPLLFLFFNCPLDMLLLRWGRFLMRDLIKKGLGLFCWEVQAQLAKHAKPIEKSTNVRQHFANESRQ